MVKLLLALGSLALLVGCGSSSPPAPEAAATSASETPTPTPTPTPSEAAGFPEPGEVGGIKGEWEDGDLLGDPMKVGLPTADILYGAQRGEVTYVATGIRDGDRTLRTIQALTPEDEEAADGIDLYGGYVLGDRGPDELVADGSYLLIGSVPGDVDVAIEQPDGSSREVTATSTTTLPGYTVFYDTADWDGSWDQVQAAPLTVTTSDGARVAVRKRTWVG